MCVEACISESFLDFMYDEREREGGKLGMVWEGKEEEIGSYKPLYVLYHVYKKNLMHGVMEMGQDDDGRGHENRRGDMRR